MKCEVVLQAKARRDLDNADAIQPDHIAEAIHY